MGGLFLGYLICILYVLVLGRARATLLPRGNTALVLLVGVAATCLDGLNAYFADIGLPHLYAPSLTLRLATGLAAGFGVAAFTLPVIAGSLWAEPDDDPAL